MEKRVRFYSWWECKLVQPLWKTVWRYLGKLNIDPPYDPAIPLLGIYPHKIFTEKDTPHFTLLKPLYVSSIGLYAPWEHVFSIIILILQIYIVYPHIHHLALASCCICCRSLRNKTWQIQLKHFIYTPPPTRGNISYIWYLPFPCRSPYFCYIYLYTKMFEGCMSLTFVIILYIPSCNLLFFVSMLTVHFNYCIFLYFPIHI